jgi:hypothetical protein
MLRSLLSANKSTMTATKLILTIGADSISRLFGNDEVSQNLAANRRFGVLLSASRLPNCRVSIS